MKDNKENMSFREKMQDKKYSAKVQLIGYTVLVLIIVIYARLESDSSSYKNIEKNTTNTTTEEENISLYDKIVNNYDYEINATIETKDNSSSYIYTGQSTINKFTIKYGENEYSYKDDLFYDINNIEVDSKTIFNDIDYKYLMLNNIKEYISKSTLDHTTNYSNNKTTTTYYLYLKDIINNYHEEDYISFDICEENDILNIDIDYTNLIKEENKDIKLKVNIKYSNIGKVEE